ncbi:MAG: hypothetical protein Q9175_002130 [Cornicularia normoerica]
MGRFLGDRITKALAADQLQEIEVVMPIPETSNTSAMVVAARLQKPESSREDEEDKIVENAREAVVNGSPGKEEIRIATNGIEVTNDGNVVPAQASITSGALAINWDGVLHTPSDKWKPWEDEEEALSRHRMDTSLHNQADFEFVETSTFCRMAKLYNLGKHDKSIRSYVPVIERPLLPSAFCVNALVGESIIRE